MLISQISGAASLPKVAAIVALVSSLVVGSITGVLVWKYQAAKHEAIHQTILASHADALSLAYQEREKLAERISELDHESSQRLKVAQDENAALAAAVANGKRRLYVAAKCPATTTSTGASVGDGEAPELNPAARPTYNALRDGITKQFEQLTTCQDILESERKQ